MQKMMKENRETVMQESVKRMRESVVITELSVEAVIRLGAGPY